MPAKTSRKTKITKKKISTDFNDMMQESIALECVSKTAKELTEHIKKNQKSYYGPSFSITGNDEQHPYALPEEYDDEDDAEDDAEDDYEEEYPYSPFSPPYSPTSPNTSF